MVFHPTDPLRPAPGETLHQDTSSSAVRLSCRLLLISQCLVPKAKPHQRFVCFVLFVCLFLFCFFFFVFFFKLLESTAWRQKSQVSLLSLCSHDPSGGNVAVLALLSFAKRFQHTLC